jgi:hypothetical protein
MRRLTIATLAAAAAVTLGAAGPAAAQAPSVAAVMPPGGQQGAKATVSVNGGNLQGATAVLISGAGVEAAIKDAANAGALALDLTIAPDAAPGVREVRVVTPRGTSNAGRIWIGVYPQAGDTEPNNTLMAAQKLAKLPLTVAGAIGGGEDVDNYSFEASAGDTYVFDLVAARMASGLDGYLALYDSKGRIVASAIDSFDRDPRLIHTFKAPGTYVVQVRDTMYRGGGNFVYGLNLGKIPAITGYLPVAGRRGSTVNVQLQGVNLGGMATVPVQMPMDQDQVTLFPTTPAGPSTTPITLRATDLPEMSEGEPNDAAAQAMALPDGPIAVSGRIDKPGDVDLYRVKAAAAATYTFDLYGSRIGSRIDSVMRILDATGKEIQANDDAVGKDSRMNFNLAANTEYLVEVKGIDQRAGGDVFYRLELAPPAGADFSLRVTPDAINVGQAGSAVVTVNAVRTNGFSGPIELRVEGLPMGVSVSPALIPAGANSAQFTLTAAAGAAPGSMGQIKVIGKGTLGDKTVEHAAVGTETYVPPLAQAEQAKQRETVFLTSTVGPQPAYVLDLDQKAITVKRGQSVKVIVKTTRQMGQNGAIALTAAGQPANVTPTVAPIPQDKNEVEITIAAAANAPLVTQNIILSGNLNNNTQVAPALTVTITE